MQTPKDRAIEAFLSPTKNRAKYYKFGPITVVFGPSSMWIEGLVFEGNGPKSKLRRFIERFRFYWKGKQPFVKRLRSTVSSHTYWALKVQRKAKTDNKFNF